MHQLVTGESDNLVSSFIGTPSIAHLASWCHSFYHYSVLIVVIIVVMIIIILMIIILGTTSTKKKNRLNGHCPFGGGVDPCPFVLVLFLY